MKSLMSAAILTLLCFSGAAKATSQQYDYSYTFSNGIDIVAGSFFGDAVAGTTLIDNLTNITANIDGIALPGSGSLYNFGREVSGWVSGAAVVDTSGINNNFGFFSTAITFKVPNYVTGGAGNIEAFLQLPQGSFIGSADSNNSISNPYSSANWNVTEVNLVSSVPAPANGWLILTGLGVIGAAVGRKKTKIVG